MKRQPSRRRFLSQLTSGAALAASGIVNPELSGAQTRTGPSLEPPQVTRVRGIVRSHGSPLPGVSVSDGASVVRSNTQGEFDLLSSSRSSFVHVSVPPGHRIPLNAPGTARFYQPIDFSRREISVAFDLEPLDSSDEDHTFVVLADPQTEDLSEIELLQQETVPDVRNLLEGYEGECFGLACGDIMFDHLELYPEYEKAVKAMGIPFFQVVGNHDLDQQAYGNHLATETFQRHFGPEYYSFNRGAVHYVVLNDVFWHGSGYIGYITDNQLAWLAQDLAHVERGSTVILAVHIPLSPTGYRRAGQRAPSLGVVVLNRSGLYELLEPFNAHVLSGHTHESEHVFEGGVHEHVHGTTCGAWWSGPICFDGTPNGYGVYEVRGEELRWYYKSTGHGRDYQVRLFSKGADPEAPDEVVANVWNWDPEWKVVWYEDGVFKGPMARRTGLDPLSVRLHSGPELPLKRPWVEPRRTDHLFYAPVSPSAREIRVEATDRFGVLYTASSERV